MRLVSPAALRFTATLRSVTVTRWLWLALASAPLRSLAAQSEAPERSVSSVKFRGNHALDDVTLEAAIATSASALIYRWLGLGQKRVFDEAEFRRDVVRVQILYRLHGYFDARVDTSVARSKTSVSVAFLINEGPPVLVDSVAVRGVDSILDVSRLLRKLPIKEGKPFDRVQFAAAADTIVAVLQNLGYPFVALYRNYRVERETRLASVEYAVVPGVRARFGEIAIVGASSVTAVTVRRLLAVRRGDWFSQDALYDTQRSLYRTDLFRYVTVAIAPDSSAGAADSTVRVVVQVTEGPWSRLRAGVGYGTIDCFRAQATLTTASFLGGGRRLDLAGKLSKMGVGRPTDLGFANSICSALSGDPFSARLNYLASATLTQPAFLTRRNTATVTTFAERRSEYKAFERDAVGGSLAMAYGLGHASLVTLTYRLTYGSTKADPAVFCVYFDRCEQATVNVLSESRRQASLSLSVVRNTANSPIEPTAGSVLLFEGSHASPLVGSDSLVSYNKLVAEGTWYAEVARRWVVAVRVRGGIIRPGLTFVADSSIRFVPPEERFYAGGPASVRGFGRNEMGPLVYVADSIVPNPATGVGVPYGLRTSPIGSYAIALANLELRFPSPIWQSRLRLVAFVDAGGLWDQTAGGLMAAGLRITPGLGVRLVTPLGPLRFDVAYNGYPRQQGPLYLVSPPTSSSPGQLVLRQENYPGPPRGTSFLQRLQFQFSVGEAY